MKDNNDGEIWEGTLSHGSAEERAWLSARIADYVQGASYLAKILESNGASNIRELHVKHKPLVRMIAAEIAGKSSNAIEQAALTSMVGTSLLATFDGQIDYINYQIDLMNYDGAKEGEGE